MPPETSQTLDRGLRLMLVVAEEPSGFTVAELAETLGLNRTVVHRLVATLEERGLLTRDDHGRVVPGAGLLRLGQSARSTTFVRASPLLRDLADAVGATSHLTVAEGDEAVAVLVVEPAWTDVHVGYRVGARHPLADAAAGRAILLGRDGGEGSWVVSDGELQTGARGLAAPIPAGSGVAASVGVVTLGDLDEPTVGAAVVRCARDVARRLGG